MKISRLGILNIMFLEVIKNIIAVVKSTETNAALEPMKNIIKSEIYKTTIFNAFDGFQFDATARFSSIIDMADISRRKLNVYPIYI